MKKQLAMVVDASSCLDCKACQAACKVANKVPEGQWRNWIKSENLDEHKPTPGFSFQPGGCMHCDRPTCVSACPTGATWKDESDGTVRIDRKLCIGCGQCIPACPYGARYRHAELSVADKCDYCADRRALGIDPACVDTCPTKARVFGDINDPESDAAKLLRNNKIVRVVNQKSNTEPNMYYLGNPGPVNWPVEAKMPTSFTLWKNILGPAVSVIVGLTGLGVAAMLFKQIAMPDDKPLDDSHSPGHGKGGGHE